MDRRTPGLCCDADPTGRRAIQNKRVLLISRTHEVLASTTVGRARFAITIGVFTVYKRIRVVVAAIATLVFLTVIRTVAVRAAGACATCQVARHVTAVGDLRRTANKPSRVTQLQIGLALTACVGLTGARSSVIPSNIRT